MVWAMIERAAVERVNVLGVGVSATHLSEATELILDGVRRGVKGYITVTGVHGIVEAQSDPELRRILNSAWMTTPDGMPTVWVGKLQGHREMGRVYGPDLMLEIFKATQDGGVRHFFYGGNVGVADALKVEMETRFPGVCVCGTFTPPFRPLTDEEEAELIGQVSASGAQLFWVGISTPKQEQFMAKMLERLPVNLLLGVGAAFDFHTGRVKQAPKWMQRSGLEWLFRTIQEPGRLGVRYLRNNPKFLINIAMQFSGLKRFPLDP